MTNLSSITSAPSGVSVPCGKEVSAPLEDREESASFGIPILVEKSVFSDFSLQPVGRKIKLKVRIKQRDFLKIWSFCNIVIPPLFHYTPPLIKGKGNCRIYIFYEKNTDEFSDIFCPDSISFLLGNKFFDQAISLHYTFKYHKSSSSVAAASNASGYPFESLPLILLVGALPQTPEQIHFVFCRTHLVWLINTFISNKLFVTLLYKILLSKFTECVYFRIFCRFW